MIPEKKIWKRKLPEKLETGCSRRNFGHSSAAAETVFRAGGAEKFPNLPYNMARVN
jgi:hypothetical protein